MSGVASSDPRLRLPREPYPGLRPFLDFEAALLYGRERQAREIIERLRATQFAAVLGSSGSGKSSLVGAGVLPKLRSYGIPGAGDLWLSLICTPGSNVSQPDRATRRHSPVARLARRFAALLRSRGSEQADADRIDEIADVFRQEAGFARLLDSYASELDLAPGPDPADALVLFVIDQFEEVFHPSNVDVEDASILVERVLDHFFDPHPRCQVVLTMRSENLGDCARYLQLPDAINRASYLVRRFDTDELRDAIMRPAQRFLRLLARSRSLVDPPLPREVQFDPEVVDRLLRDVSAIAHDPDHLPLLQHLLARLWQAALEREEISARVPTRITRADLARAINAGSVMPPGEPPPDDAVNSLRASATNWPEALYQWHDEDARSQLERVFTRLAFKDPASGSYKQQRAAVEDLVGALGPGATRDSLRALLAEGFLGSVDYLFWDDEEPGRETLQVSHEAFIRGWLRLRGWVDRESDRFDEFARLMRRLADWAAHRSDDYLLEVGEMRRLNDAAVLRDVASPIQRAAWMRLLALDKDGSRLAAQEPLLDTFISNSERRLAQRRLRERRSRTIVFCVGAIVLFGVAMGAWLTWMG